MDHNEITGFAPQSVVGYLEEAHQGRVLMANSAGIYLTLDGQILLICDEIWGCVPIGIGIRNFAEVVKKLPLTVGDPVSCGKSCLHLGGRRITITEIKWKCTVSGDKEHLLLLSGGIDALRHREKGLAPLASRLLEGDPSEENWNPWCRMACPRLETLCRGLQTGDAAAVERCVKSLLGLGPGLTPSADDVLCGMLYPLLQEGHPGASMLRQAVCDHADSRTHPVSAAYLKAIANGEVFSRLEDVWFGRENSLEALLEVGSSSGADMLLGLCLAENLLKSLEIATPACLLVRDDMHSMGMEEKSDG